VAARPMPGPLDTAHRPRPTGQWPYDWPFPGREQQIPASPGKSPCCIPDRPCSPSHVTGCQSVLFAELLRPRGDWRPWRNQRQLAGARSFNHVCVNGHGGLSDSAGVKALARANQGPLRRAAHAPPVEYHDFGHGRATSADEGLQRGASRVPLGGALVVGPPDSMGRYGE
jgi:hypothetical protein